MYEDRIPTLSSMTRESGLVIIRLRGELDSLGTRLLQPAFAVALSDRTVTAIVDLSEVPFLTSKALAMFLAHGQAMHRAGGSLHLAGANGTVTEVLELAGFDDLFCLAPTLEEAIDRLEAELAASSEAASSEATSSEAASSEATSSEATSSEEEDVDP
jgi:anti-anti-sigma factor